jgi:CMP-N,N'-diacetyllegionaminic acid synthase
VPRKNIRLLGGRPLLHYTADAALAARRLSRVVLSTDDEEIADEGRRCGLEVPFLRPAELARDDTPSLPVIQHALAWLEAAGHRFDAVCLLQPTSPFRPPGLIDGCVGLMERTGADAVATVLRVPPEHHPYWVYLPDEQGLLRLTTGESEPIPRRQDLPPAFYREGSVYVARRDVVMDHGTLYGERFVGYLFEGPRVNLDTLEDWQRAEMLLQRA